MAVLLEPCLGRRRIGSPGNIASLIHSRFGPTKATVVNRK